MAPNFRHRRRSQTSSAPRRRRAWMFKLSSIVYDMHTRCLSKIRDKKIASVLCSSRRVLCRRDELAIKSSYVWGQQDLTLTPPYTGCFLFANRMRAGTRPTGGCPPWALISHAVAGIPSHAVTDYFLSPVKSARSCACGGIV